MTYDPVLMKWKGNDSELLEFEKRIAQKAAKPKLIQQKSSQLPTKIGNMVFDPIALVWRGNEDLDDAHIFDEIDALTVSATKKYESGLDKLLMEQFHKCEVAHKLLMGNWFPLALGKMRITNNSSRSYLYDIRTIKV